MVAAGRREDAAGGDSVRHMSERRPLDRDPHGRKLHDPTSLKLLVSSTLVQELTLFLNFFSIYSFLINLDATLDF